MEHNENIHHNADNRTAFDTLAQKMFQAHCKSNLSMNLKAYVVLYSEAMDRNVEIAESFDKFLLQEEDARSKALEKLATDFADRESDTCFCMYTSELKKLMDDQRHFYEKKFLCRHTHLVAEKMRQTLMKYDKSMGKHCDGINADSLKKMHNAASQVAENSLKHLSALKYDQNLWAEAKIQLNDTIEMLQQHHVRANQLMTAQRKSEAGTMAQIFINADEIKVDMSKDGFLGRGGFGKVRVGFIKCYGVVAIKAISFCGSKREIERAEQKFIKEIELLHHANHDNIVRILGYTSWCDWMAILIEYMSGGSLRDLIFLKEKDDSFLVSEIPHSLCLRFCSDISNGVSYLHFAFYDQRMVHGDLKPSNVMLTSDLRCKVGDFGGADIATCTEFASSSTRLTKQSGEWTQGYIAPERLNNLQLRVSKAMDAYSVGMVFYVIMRRQSPSKDVDQNLKEILRYCGQFDSDSIIVTTIKKFIQKCTDRHSLQRPSMLTVRDELQTLLRKQDASDIVLAAADVLKALECPNASAHSSGFVSLTNQAQF